VSDFFDLYQPKVNAAHSLMSILKNQIEKLDSSVAGFNVRMNAGKTAGQTIFHCHVHLIPRRKGDMEDPRGGVRGVIPERRIY
jgi:ATP adenylyltransferase